MVLNMLVSVSLFAGRNAGLLGQLIGAVVEGKMQVSSVSSGLSHARLAYETTWLWYCQISCTLIYEQVSVKSKR